MRHLILPALAALSLAACGGGDGGAPGTAPTDTPPDTPTAAVDCNTAAYQAGAVAKPTAEELALYTGTFDGAEGSFDANGNFVKSASATLVFDGSASLSYKDKAYAVSSICIDKTAGPYGRLLYVLAGTGGGFDMSTQVASADLGQVWGSSPADGGTLFQQGKKR